MNNIDKKSQNPDSFFRGRALSNELSTVNKDFVFIDLLVKEVDILCYITI